MKPARVIAHRGGAGTAPENTVAAFRLAKEAGVTWVECDAVLLKDGEIVLHHDQTLERTTNGTGEIADRSLPYIQSLDAGTWFGPQFHGEPVPRLADALEVFEELDLHANIELKVHDDEGRKLAQGVAIRLNQSSSGGQRHLVSSFSRPALREFRRVSATDPIALLYGSLPMIGKKMRMHSQPSGSLPTMRTSRRPKFATFHRQASSPASIR